MRAFKIEFKDGYFHADGKLRAAASGYFEERRRRMAADSISAAAPSMKFLRIPPMEKEDVVAGKCAALFGARGQ